jgi:hypothetical protein
MQLHPLKSPNSGNVECPPAASSLCHSHVALRIAIDGASPTEDVPIFQQQPLCPAVGTLPEPFIEIPIIHRFSATPEVSHRNNDSGSTTPATAQQAPWKTQLKKHTQLQSSHYRNLPQPSQLRSVVSPLGITPVPTPTISSSHQIPDDYFSTVRTTPGSHTPNKAPDKDSPIKIPSPVHLDTPMDRDKSASTSNAKAHHQKPKRRGVRAVYAATKVKDEKDDTIPDDYDLRQERPNAGPTIN